MHILHLLHVQVEGRASILKCFTLHTVLCNCAVDCSGVGVWSKSLGKWKKHHLRHHRACCKKSTGGWTVQCVFKSTAVDLLSLVLFSDEITIINMWNDLQCTECFVNVFMSSVKCLKGPILKFSCPSLPLLILPGNYVDHNALFLVWFVGLAWTLMTFDELIWHEPIPPPPSPWPLRLTTSDIWWNFTVENSNPITVILS